MSALAQWWTELRQPTLKCARIGHRGYRQTRDGYLPDSPGFFGGVAKSVRQEREVCSRCGGEVSPWTTLRRTSLNSLTASPEIWDAIRAGGWWSDGSHKNRGVEADQASKATNASHAAASDTPPGYPQTPSNQGGKSVG